MVAAAIGLAVVACAAGIALVAQAIADAGARRWPAARGPTCTVPGCLHRAGHLGAHEGERGPV